MGGEPFDYVFVLVTGLIAWHGITWRDAEGESDFTRLLMGCIALLFCLRILFVDILGLIG